ncbi:hypothetical protein SCLCIDRAFT_157221 [Scleroderma citrinum Foug A]|uniref:Uncharacterized protein n=1 Tax=Scleroderma citrinum Foug A TaxID=1036808 RepID=A0A0C3B049_9AGAM|nr:hypothetical protein SCLCIDRAFT_157221 [Scleroderma citrinum Foug A]
MLKHPTSGIELIIPSASGRENSPYTSIANYTPESLRIYGWLESAQTFSMQTRVHLCTTRLMANCTVSIGVCCLVLLSPSLFARTYSPTTHFASSCCIVLSWFLERLSDNMQQSARAQQQHRSSIPSLYHMYFFSCSRATAGRSFLHRIITRRHCGPSLTNCLISRLG